MSSAASVSEYAKQVVAEVDTHGDQRVYALAEDYLRLEDKIQRAIEAMPAVSATYAAYAILTGVFDA